MRDLRPTRMLGAKPNQRAIRRIKETKTMRSPFLARRLGKSPAHNPTQPHSRRLRVPRPAMVVAIFALTLATVGSATAAKLITGKQIKNASVTGKDVKDRSLSAADFSGSVEGPRGPQGEPGPAGPAGPAGSARAYAHVTFQGGALTFDAARSKNIAGISEGDDFICIDAAVPVSNAIAAADFNGGASPIADAAVLYDTTSCPAGTDVQVATKYEGHGLVQTPFSVWFN
jgi:hypothetical protein